MSGRVFLLGDGVSTDAIMPGRYNVTTDPDALQRSCLIEARPDFVETVQPGDVIVAGRNFGCGSSREHAPLSIKRNGVAAVIAASFARIFYRNAVNIGLPVIRCAEAHRVLHDGDEVTVDAMTGLITTATTTLQGEPPSGVALRIIEAGSLVDLIRRGGWAALEEQRRVS
ncbi:MAG: 3-isopropylmalate dehydratase small subunit [Candidatus Dormibacteria bacterium]